MRHLSGKIIKEKVRRYMNNNKRYEKKGGKERKERRS